MAPEPDPERSSQVLIAQTKPEKQKPMQPQAEHIADFRFDSAKLKEIKETLGITDFNVGETRIILERIYEGLKTRDKPDTERKINITYEENKGLVREPATVLNEGKADCDEVTRTAYLLASESGVKNIAMVEMKWTDPKTNERTGHSFIVLMPQEKDGIPRIYDLTYFKKGKLLTIENNDLETAIRKEYATDAVNPNFGVITRSNLNEVEAAHYEWVGKYYAKKIRWNEAAEAYGRAVSLAPTEFEYAWGLAVSYDQQNDYKSAIGYYEKCLSLEKVENAKLYGALGSVYGLDGQYAKAEIMLIKALELNPNEALRIKLNENLKVVRTQLEKTKE